MNKKKEYGTESFYLACFLACKGMQLIRIDRPFKNGKAVFVFADCSERDEWVQDFLINEDATVSVKKFINQIRRLKSGLYDGL